MKRPTRPSKARVLHWLFETSLAIKGLLCSAEFLAGVGLLLTPNPLVARLLYWLTHFQIAETRTDTLAAWTQRAMEGFPTATQDFYGWYLLLHGGLKLAMVAMLWARILWAYPAAMVVLSGFVIYQLFEFLHNGSPFLLMLAFFDLMMIALVWQEYKALKVKRSTAMAAAH
ncbi:DUF2127 domain-containing protein [Cypionkella sp.]|uniref:DUF2127 domain-containing protein n=1 Tax=Cypionkella sp. TaxID=2811411 RepID=UPI002620DF2C|nr:DUF2127 domain-containing protein [Cypionkella sp.]MDB5665433.1 hypothetical protein [Cypionkella sp.]